MYAYDFHTLVSINVGARSKFVKTRTKSPRSTLYYSIFSPTLSNQFTKAKKVELTHLKLSLLLVA